MAKTNYINAELDWAETKLQEWQEYIDANPIHLLQDRTEIEEIKTGTRVKVIATIETQGKYIQEMMKNYLSLLSEVNKLREVEEKKKEARGRGEVPHRMK
jgi:hypothetical protein